MGMDFAPQAFRQLLEKFALFGFQFLGNLNAEDDELVASPVAAQVRDAFPPHPQDLPGLGPGWDRENGGPIHSGDINIRAEGSLGKVDIEVEDDICIPPLEILMPSDLDDEVKVSWRASVHAWLAFSGEPDLGAVIHTGRDVNSFLASLAFQTAPLALLTGS